MGSRVRPLKSSACKTSKHTSNSTLDTAVVRFPTVRDTYLPIPFFQPYPNSPLHLPVEYMSATQDTGRAELCSVKSSTGGPWKEPLVSLLIKKKKDLQRSWISGCICSVPKRHPYSFVQSRIQSGIQRVCRELEKERLPWVKSSIL